MKEAQKVGVFDGWSHRLTQIKAGGHEEHEKHKKDPDL
jgi:hypothetical protein